MIVTFYSFKGGVGRSMALANVGWLLFRLGLRVTIVDWDLEAPGVDRFITEAAALEASSSPGLPLAAPILNVRQVRQALLSRTRGTRGITDLIHQYCSRVDALAYRGPTRETATLFDEGGAVRAELIIERELLPALAECLTTVISRPSGSCLRFLGSGRSVSHAAVDDAAEKVARTSSAGYGEELRAINWADLYQKYGGELLFNRLASALASDADVVLIDSRTGVTEMGGTCVLGMADMAVLMCYPNHQNLDGVIGVAQAIEEQNRRGQDSATGDRRDRRIISWLPVLSRIDLSQPSQLEEFTSAFVTKSLAMLTKFTPSPWVGEASPMAPMTGAQASGQTAFLGASRRLRANQHVRIPYDSRVSFAEQVVAQHRGIGGAALYHSLLEPYREISHEVLAEILARREMKSGGRSLLPRCTTPLPQEGSAVETIWIMCAPADIEWAHLLATKLGTSEDMQSPYGRKHYRFLIGFADAISWWRANRCTTPETQTAARPAEAPDGPVSTNPFQWLADRTVVNHIVPLISTEYMREFESWNPLLIAFGMESRRLEDLLYTPTGHNPDVTPLVLDTDGGLGTDEIPPSLRASTRIPKWTRPMQMDDKSFFQRVVGWITNPNARGAGSLLQFRFDDSPSTRPGFTTDPEILENPTNLTARLEEVKRKLDIANTTGSALKWWAAFEAENSHRRNLVLRLAEELEQRKATITEFFLAYVYSNTDNIQANLHYLDYTRLKKEEELRKKERVQAEKATEAIVREPPQSVNSPVTPALTTLPELGSTAEKVAPLPSPLAPQSAVASAGDVQSSGASPAADNPLSFIRCPHCRSLVPHVSRRCRMCGRELP